MPEDPGLGRAVSNRHTYDDTGHNLGFVDYILEAAKGFDQNKALFVAGSLSAIAIAKGSLPFALKAIGTAAATVVTLAAASDIRNENLAQQAARREDIARTVEILERS